MIIIIILISWNMKVSSSTPSRADKIRSNETKTGPDLCRSVRLSQLQPTNRNAAWNKPLQNKQENNYVGMKQRKTWWRLTSLIYHHQCRTGFISVYNGYLCRWTHALLTGVLACDSEALSQHSLSPWNYLPKFIRFGISVWLVIKL